MVLVGKVVVVVTSGATSRGVTPSVRSCDFEWDGLAALETLSGVGTWEMVLHDTKLANGSEVFNGGT